MDGMVCAKDSGAEYVELPQYDINNDILQSLSFQSDTKTTSFLYNYRYPEILQTNCFSAS